MCLYLAATSHAHFVLSPGGAASAQTLLAADCLAAPQEGVSTPIIDAVYRIVHERAEPLATLDQLMSLDLMPEVDEAVLAASAATHLLTERRGPA